MVHTTVGMRVEALARSLSPCVPYIVEEITIFISQVTPIHTAMPIKPSHCMPFGVPKGETMGILRLLIGHSTFCPPKEVAVLRQGVVTIFHS